MDGAAGQQGRSGVDGQLVVEENMVGQLDKRIQQQVSAQAERIAQQALLAKQQALEIENKALLEKLADTQTPQPAIDLKQRPNDIASELSALTESHKEQAEKINRLENLVEQLQRQMQQALEALETKQ